MEQRPGDKDGFSLLELVVVVAVHGGLQLGAVHLQDPSHSNASCLQVTRPLSSAAI